MKRERAYFRVLVVSPLSTGAGRMKLNGINRFLDEGHDWDIELVRSEAEFTPDVFQSGAAYDGVFTGWPETPEIEKAHFALHVPSVYFGDRRDAPKYAREPMAILFHDDTKSIIRAAIRHFNTIGRLVSYGYVPTRTEKFWSAERAECFRDELARSGAEPFIFKGGDLAEWLKALPKPAGVLAAFDDRAADVLAACRKADLSVPDDVSVLGIGNDTLVCERTKPRLSSVAIDFEEQGYRAARELHAMMLASRKPRDRTIATGKASVAARASTSRESPAGALVRRAVQFIATNAKDGIRPRDVVCHVRVSRRLLDLRFREVTGKSVMEAIRETRLAAVAKMLVTGGCTIGEIAVRCGYVDANYLKNQFKKAYGVSMREYRRLNRRRA